MGCNTDLKAKQNSSGVRNPPAPHAHTCCTPARALAWTSLFTCPHPAAQFGVWGRWPVLQRQRRFLLSAAQRSRKAAAVREANTGRVRPGEVGNGRHLPGWYPCPSQWGKEQVGTVPMPRNGGPPMHPDVGEPRPCGLPGAALPARVVPPFALPPAPWVPHGVQQCGLRVPIPAPCWASLHLGWGQAGRDEAEIKLLMSPSVTGPPITGVGNEEMMECDWGRGAGCRGLQYGGDWGVSPSLPNFLIALLWGVGQKGPRGDQALTIPEAPRYLGGD